MTTGSMTTSTTAGQSSSGVGEEGSTTDQAKEQAKQVAGVATDEVKSVAGDVREQARGLLDETKSQVQDQSRTQRDRLVDTLRTLGDDLDGMAEQRSGLASDAAREVANRARSFSQQLEGREPSDLLDDLRSFARRRPGMFLAGALISGVVVGRILRGTRDAAQDGTSSGNASGGYDSATTQERPLTSYDPTPTATASPTAPLDEPLAAPAAYPPVSPGLSANEPGIRSEAHDDGL
jgi:uncharacterized protein YjbJ (UPF0337 family)